jgi:hypothetical protein
MIGSYLGVKRIGSDNGTGNYLKFMAPKALDSALAGLKRMGSSDEVIKAQPRLMNEAFYVFARVRAYLDAWRTLIESLLTLRGTAAWINPATGTTLGTQQVSPGQQTLTAPAFTTDTALIIAG